MGRKIEDGKSGEKGPELIMNMHEIVKNQNLLLQFIMNTLIDVSTR